MVEPRSEPKISLINTFEDGINKELFMFTEGKLQKKCKWLKNTLKNSAWDFPGGAVVRKLPANAGDTGSIPGPGRSHMPRSN